MNQKKTAAVVRLSALGDCVLLQPALIHWLEHDKDLQIDWYIDGRFAGLFDQVDRLNLIPIQKPKKLKDYYRLYKAHFRHHHYDILLAAQASFRSNLFYPLIRAKIKLGFDRQRAKDGQWLFTNAKIQSGRDHLLEGFWRFAAYFTQAPVAPRWQMHVNGFGQSIKSLTQADRLIGVSFLASKLERSPYPEQWVDFITGMHQAALARGIKLEFCAFGGGSRDELEFADQVLKALHKRPEIQIKNCIGQTSVEDLSSGIAAMDCVISPDSGPVHLARAHQVQVIGLYTVVPLALSGPYGAYDYSVDVYEQAVVQYLKKDTHQVRWGERVHNREAMALISQESVVKRFEKLLDQWA